MQEDITNLPLKERVKQAPYSIIMPIKGGDQLVIGETISAGIKVFDGVSYFVQQIQVPGGYQENVSIAPQPEKNVLTTREAFEKLIRKRGWYKPLGIPEGTGSSVKTYYKQGRITLDRMEELLTMAGFTVKQEKLWEKKQD